MMNRPEMFVHKAGIRAQHEVRALVDGAGDLDQASWQACHVPASVQPAPTDSTQIVIFYMVSIQLVWIQITNLSTPASSHLTPEQHVLVLTGDVTVQPDHLHPTHHTVILCNIIHRVSAVRAPLKILTMPWS